MHGNIKEPISMLGLECNGSKVMSYYRDRKSTKSEHSTWFLNVKCKCGREFIVQKNRFTAGKHFCHICSKIPDLSGKKFNMLTVIDLQRVNNNSFWNCLCDCGNMVVVRARNLPNIKSCGCFTRTSTTHGMSNTPTYSAWTSMIRRATSKTSPRAKDYILRGITVCDRWLKFENFYSDMGEKPAGMSLDRKDNNGIYTKENCRWATASEQMSNRRVNNNTSGRIGVSFCKLTGKWKVRLRSNKVCIWLGRYESFSMAKQIIEDAELKYLGYSRAEGFDGGIS